MTDLENRVAKRKQELVSELVEHKKNSSRACAADQIDRLKLRLSELAYLVKEGVVDGWGSVNPSSRRKLDDWIAR